MSPAMPRTLGVDADRLSPLPAVELLLRRRELDMVTAE